MHPMSLSCDGMGLLRVQMVLQPPGVTPLGSCYLVLLAIRHLTSFGALQGKATRESIGQGSSLLAASCHERGSSDPNAATEPLPDRRKANDALLKSSLQRGRKQPHGT